LAKELGITFLWEEKQIIWELDEMEVRDREMMEVGQEGRRNNYNEDP